MNYTKKVRNVDFGENESEDDRFSVVVKHWNGMKNVEAYVSELVTDASASDIAALLQTDMGEDTLRDHIKATGFKILSGFTERLTGEDADGVYRPKDLFKLTVATVELLNKTNMSKRAKHAKAFRAVNKLWEVTILFSQDNVQPPECIVAEFVVARAANLLGIAFDPNGRLVNIQKSDSTV